MCSELADPQEFQTSLAELSKELKLLGLKPLVSHDPECLPVVCESLLNCTWGLIQLVHCSAMSIRSKDDDLAKEREQCIIDDMQSLQTQVARLKKKLDGTENLLAQTKEVNRKLNEDLVQCHKDIKKHASEVSKMTSRLERHESFYKSELYKKEAECEQLRILVRKSQDPGYLVTRSTFCGSVSTSQGDKQNNPEISIKQSVVDRLTGINQELVKENLMLRDALCCIHIDLKRLSDNAKAATDMGDETGTSNDCFSSAVFQLPLSQTMSTLLKMGKERIHELNAVLSSVDKITISE